MTQRCFCWEYYLFKWSKILSECLLRSFNKNMNSKIITLYHGTSIANADKIMASGFLPRNISGNSNWKGVQESQPDLVYLTRAYPFFYGMSASGDDKRASVIKVEVDVNDLYPDEDFLTQCLKNLISKESESFDVKLFKRFGEMSLEKLGNVAIEPKNIKRIIGRKDFNVMDMLRYSDPCMNTMNYRFCGAYYRELTDNWFEGKPYEHLNAITYLD